MARVISLTGQKGGIGKTTSCIHIGSFLASQGYSVAIIDFDTSQANATRSLMGPFWEGTEEERIPGICDVIVNCGKIDDVIYKTKIENLFIVPSEKFDSNGQPYNIEGSLVAQGIGGYTALGDLIENSTKLSEMNFILIDNAPSLGIGAVSSLAASDYYLIPVQTADFSMESIEDTVRTAKKVKKSFNSELEPLGFFISSMDKRGKMGKEAIIELTEMAKKKNLYFFETKIPISTKFQFLPREKKTIFDIPGKNIRGKQEYYDLASEILKRIMDIEAPTQQHREVRV